MTRGVNTEANCNFVVVIVVKGVGWLNCRRVKRHGLLLTQHLVLRKSSVAEQVAEGFSRIRAGTIVLVNPPRTLTTKKNTNPCVQSIIKWVKTKSFWIVWLEILIFVTVSGFIVWVLEQGHESVVEENLRSVLAKVRSE